jgi:hypothetical protein
MPRNIMRIFGSLYQQQRRDLSAVIVRMLDLKSQ